jgi:transposase
MAYPDVVKARMIRRLAGPQPQALTDLAIETGIAQSTLFRWLQEAGKTVIKSRKSDSSPSNQPAAARRPQDITAVERARFVVEGSTLSGEARGIFLRENGLHEEQLQAWTSALSTSHEAGPSARTTKADAKRIRQLEKELVRKDRALAEAAALMVLQKKAALYFGVDEEDDTPEKSGR